MKKLLFLTVLWVALFAKAQESNQQLIQLTIYTFTNDTQLATTEAYLQEAYVPALQWQEIPVGVFKVRPPADTLANQLYVLVPFNSLQNLTALDQQLAQDTDYQSAGKAYLQAVHDTPPFARKQTVLLTAFEDMPQLQPTKVTGPRAERVYELRSYQSPTEAYFTNKVDMFNAGGEVQLFEDLGFNAVFYGEVIAGPDMPNLMYMTTFENWETREAHWKRFVDSPVWKALSSDPQYQHNVSHIDITFLYPTEYSDY